MADELDELPELDDLDGDDADDPEVVAAMARLALALAGGLLASASAFKATIDGDAELWDAVIRFLLAFGLLRLGLGAVWALYCSYRAQAQRTQAEPGGATRSDHPARPTAPRPARAPLAAERPDASSPDDEHHEVAVPDDRSLPAQAGPGSSPVSQ